MSELFANDFATALATDCTNVAGTIAVVAAAPAALQGGQFRAVIGAELVLVTAGQSGTTWTVTRGIEGTTAAAHAGGATVAHVLTAASLDNAAAGTQLFDAYASKPDGIPAIADSTQTWTVYPTSGNQAMRVVSGKLTNLQASGQAAGYLQRDLGAPVTRIGVDFTLGTQTTDNGCANLVIWKAPITDGAHIPDSNLHLTITRLGWSVSKVVSETLTLLAAAVFSTPLACDGSTVHHVDAVLNGNSVTILQPDGVVVTVTDAAIGTTPGHIACFETYAVEAATDAKASFVAVWANAASLASSPQMANLSPEKLLPILPTLPLIQPVTARWLPSATDVDVPVYPPAEVSTALRVTAIVPSSGGFVVDIFGYIQLGAATEVFWEVLDITGGGVSVGTCRPIHPGDVLSYIHPRMMRVVVPAGSYPPRSIRTLSLGHWATVADAWTQFHVDSAGQYAASFTVSPL